MAVPLHMQLNIDLLAECKQQNNQIHESDFQLVEYRMTHDALNALFATNSHGWLTLK